MAESWAPQSPSASHYSNDDDEPVHPQHQGYRGSVSLSLPYSPPTSSPTFQPKALPLSDPPSQSMPRGLRKEESMQDADYVPEHDAPLAPLDTPRGKGVKREDNGAPQPPPDVNITVHFPVARIKRIMQADDDVGKVAQVTPVVVCEYSPSWFLPSLVAVQSKIYAKRVSPTFAAQRRRGGGERVADPHTLPSLLPGY